MTELASLEKLAKELRIGYLKANHWEELIPLNAEKFVMYLPMARYVQRLILEAKIEVAQDIKGRHVCLNNATEIIIDRIVCELTKELERL